MIKGVFQESVFDNYRIYYLYSAPLLWHIHAHGVPSGQNRQKSTL